MIRISTFLLCITLLAACNTSNSTEEQSIESSVDTTEVKLEKESLQPKDLVEGKNEETLNEAQKQVQSLLKSCVASDFKNAAKTMMYMGGDEARIGNDHFDAQNQKELATVKVTCEVLSDWLGEAENYEFVSYSADTTDLGIEHKVEVLFKKSDIGMQRHFFFYKETAKGLLLFNMI